ncbi:MAG: AsmA family protein [Methyloprofundus sp.]|nr:AsmA family protein [Methyloprofundus sp.]
MGKLAKGIVIFFSALLVLIIAAVIIIPLVVDINDYKPEMEAAVKDATGRNLTIEGDLQLSVFPWLGVSTGKIVLSNAAGFSEKAFAVIGESDIKVKLLPLFSKEVEVSTVVLKGLQLNLEKNKAGVSNWDDLTQPKEAETSKAETPQVDKESTDTTPALAALAIGGVTIENALLSWDDQQAGQSVIIKDFNLKTGALAFNETIAIDLAFLLENAKPVMTEKFSLSTQLIIDNALQNIQLTKLKINSKTLAESIPGGVFDAQILSELALDLQQQTLALTGLQLNTNIVDLAGDINVINLNTEPQYTGSLQLIEFNPKKLMRQLKMEPPVTADAGVLQKLAIRFKLQGTADAVAIDDLQINLDDSLIKGYVHVKQFKQPAIDFNLAIDAINIDRYTAPVKEQPKVAPVTSPATAVAAATTLIPVETIRSLNVTGDLLIEQLQIAKLKMDKVSLNIQAKQGVLRTKQSIKQLYHGSYYGQIRVNAARNTPTITLNEKISNVQLEPLLQDMQPNAPAQITGAANISAKLAMRGNTVAAIKASLGGDIAFKLNNSAILGFNVQEMIDLGKLVVGGKSMQQSYVDKQTVFSVIQGTATINKGLVKNKDLLAESSTIEVKGSGTVNLVNEAIDYQVKAKIKQAAGKDIKIKGRPIAINFRGTFAEPTYSVDVMSMLSDKEKQKVDKLMNKGEKEIDKALGKGTGKAVNDLLKSFF